jgi:hypothetical protein
LQVLEEQRSVTNRDWETRNRELLGVIKGEEAVVGNQKHRQKVEACKSLKKLVMDAFNRHIQIKFAQWQRNMQAKIQKVAVLDRQLVRYERRLKRLAFIQYCEKTDLVIQDVKGDQRGAEARALLT